MSTTTPDTEQLLRQASASDAAARQQLLVRHRNRLWKMVRVRMDRPLAAQVDLRDVARDSSGRRRGQALGLLEEGAKP